GATRNDTSTVPAISDKTAHIRESFTFTRKPAARSGAYLIRSSIILPPGRRRPVSRAPGHRPPRATGQAHPSKVGAVVGALSPSAFPNHFVKSCWIVPSWYILVIASLTASQVFVS